LAEMLFLGMEAEKSDARGIMVLRSEKLMVLSQKSDQEAISIPVEC
jgi:hypothetical protein